MLSDPTEVPEMNIGKYLLSPTRTYAPVIAAMLSAHRQDLHGMIHCSGGGQTKILHFLGNQHVVKDNLFPIPPLFRIIQEQSATPWKEMYRVFNMGHRFELYVPDEVAAELIRIAASFDLEARIIGRVEPSAGPSLTIRTVNGEFTY